MGEEPVLIINPVITNEVLNPERCCYQVEQIAWLVSDAHSSVRSTGPILARLNDDCGCFDASTSAKLRRDGLRDQSENRKSRRTFGKEALYLWIN